MNQRVYKSLALLVVTLALGACGSEPELPAGAGKIGSPVDMSGDWEVDYSQSENIRDRYDTMIRDLQRQAERRARNGSAQSNGSISLGGVNAGQNLYALARMAELITDVQLLDIEQDDFEISVKREGNFALQCEFYGGQLHRIDTPLGSEICGWDGHQLVFYVSIPDGVRVNHRFTLGPDGQRLNIATTVQSQQIAYPFTINRVYNRYDPESSGIRCKQTLSRGRVCTTEKESK
jgi:hypothetical protein